MKIKYAIIPKLHNLSASEMDLLIYMAECQNTATGTIEGVYYRDAMKHTGRCKQSVYNALKGLEKKHIITVQKNSKVDYDICILDNACPTEKEWKEGYIKLSRKAFASEDFKRLKAHEKYLLFEFLKCTHENGHSMCRKVEDFCDKYEKLLNVSRRVFKGYLHSLKKFFSIGIKDGKYYITYLHSVFANSQGGKSEERRYQEQLVKKECHRLHIMYNEKQLEDTAYFIKQYYKWVSGKREMIQTLMSCIRRSVDGIRYSKRTLKNKYIHKLIKNELNIPTIPESV